MWFKSFLYVSLLYSSVSSSLVLVDYTFVRESTWFPYEVTKKNLDEIRTVLSKTTESTLIFPEYAVVTTDVIRLTSGSHLDPYSFYLPIEGTNLCDVLDSNISEVLQELGCIVQHYQKNILIHVIEKNSTDTYYSTFIFITSEGVLKHMLRKSHIMDEKLIKPYTKTQNHVFEIENEKYGVLIGYDLLTVPEKLISEKVIYFGFLEQSLPLFFDVSLMKSYSEAYGKIIVSPKIIGSSTISRNSFNSSNKDKDLVNIKNIPNDENKMNELNLKDGKAHNNWCSVKVEVDNENDLSQYKLAVFNQSYTLWKTKKNLMICGLISNNSEKTLNFKKIKLTVPQFSDAIFIPSVTADEFSLKIEENTNKFNLVGTNLKNVFAFSFIMNDSHLYKDDSNRIIVLCVYSILGPLYLIWIGLLIYLILSEMYKKIGVQHCKSK